MDPVYLTAPISTEMGRAVALTAQAHPIQRLLLSCRHPKYITLISEVPYVCTDCSAWFKVFPAHCQHDFQSQCGRFCHDCQTLLSLHNTIETPSPVASSAASAGLPAVMARLCPEATETMEHIRNDPDAMKAVDLLCRVDGYLAIRKLHVVSCAADQSAIAFLLPLPPSAANLLSL